MTPAAPRPRVVLLASLLAAVGAAACDDSPVIETAEEISYAQGRVSGRELGTETFVGPTPCVSRTEPILRLLAPSCITRFNVFEGPAVEQNGGEVYCVYKASWSYIPGGCSNAGRPLATAGTAIVAPLSAGAWG